MLTSGPPVNIHGTMTLSVSLSPAHVDISAPRNAADWADAARLLADYSAWLEYASGYEDPNITRECGAETSPLSLRYVTPNGALVLARFAGHAVGITAVKRLSGEVAELKHVYLRPSARGLGLAPQMIEAAIDAARRLRVKRLVLETHNEIMPAAVKLYRRYGFEEIADYTSLSEVIPGVIAMQLVL